MDWKERLMAEAEEHWIFPNGTVVHKSAKIDDSVILRAGVYIGSLVEIEKNVRVANHVTIDMGCKVGENTNIQDSCYFPAFTIIGNNCFFATDSRGTDERYPAVGKQIRCPLVFEDDVISGAGAGYVGGIKVQRGAVIAAHAFVMNDIMTNQVVGGCPAKSLLVNYCFHCGHALVKPFHNKFKCSNCKKIFDEENRRPMNRQDYDMRKQEWETLVVKRRSSK